MEKKSKFLVRLKKSIVQLIGPLCMLALAAAIGIYLGLNKTNNVEKYVNEAFEYFADDNWVALYNYAEVVDNDFINEYFFEQFVGSYYGEHEVDELSVGDITVDGKQAIAEFISTATGKQEAWEIKFAQKYETNYILFPQWRLDISDSILDFCTVTVPSGFTVYLDGIALTDNNTNIIEEEQIVTYTIPRVFKGEHTLYIENDDFEVLDIKTVWEEDGDSYALDTSLLVVNEEDTDIMKSDAQSIVMGMYSAIFAESGIGDVSKYFLQDEATLSMLTSVYDSMLAAINPDDGSTLNSMVITVFNQDEFVYTHGDGVDVKVSFECTFEAKGKRSDVGGVRKTYEGTSGSEITLHFAKSEGKWYCNNLNMTCIDYSEKLEDTEEATQ